MNCTSKTCFSQNKWYEVSQKKKNYKNKRLKYSIRKLWNVDVKKVVRGDRPKAIAMRLWKRIIGTIQIEHGNNEWSNAGQMWMREERNDECNNEKK